MIDIETLKRINSYSAPYLGLAELADVFAVSKQAMYRRLMRGLDKELSPIVKLAMGPVWDKNDVLQYVIRNLH